MNTLSRLGLAMTVVSLMGCDKGQAPAPKEVASAAAPAPSAPAAADPTMAAAAAVDSTGTKPHAVSAIQRPGPVGDASLAATAGDAAAPAASASAGVAIAAAAPSASAVAATKGLSPDEIPKPCDDAFGRLGHLTFTDVGGGKMRIVGSKNSSATCAKLEPTKFQCDWVVDGKATGSFVDKIDPAHKSVNGSIAKGQMFNCPQH